MAEYDGKIAETYLKPRVPMPGPGQYYPENSFHETSARAYTFGTRAGGFLKEPLKENPNQTQQEKARYERMMPPPGPGAYNPTLDVKKGDQFSCSAFGRNIKEGEMANHPERFYKGETPGPNAYFPKQSYKYSHNQRDVIIQERYKKKTQGEKESLSAASYFPQVRLDYRGKVIYKPYKEKPRTIEKTDGPSPMNYTIDYNKLYPGNHADKVIREPYRKPEERLKQGETPAPNAYVVENRRATKGARIGVRYNDRVNTF